MFVNLDKYILQFRQILLAIGTNMYIQQFREIYFTIWTNTVQYSLNKHI